MFNFLFYFIGCFFLFCFWFCLLIKNRFVCFEFSEFLAFQVVLVKFERGFQKKNLSSFNPGLIWFEYHGTFLYMQLVLLY